MRCLLDKVTARRILEGLLKLGEARELTEDELFTLDFYSRAEAEGLRLFIAPPTENVLQRLEALPRYSAIIRLFRNRVEVALPPTISSVGQDGYETMVSRERMLQSWLWEPLAPAKKAAFWAWTSWPLLISR